MTNPKNATGACSSPAAPSLAAQFGLEPDFTLSPELTASLVEEATWERAYEKAQKEESLFQARKAVIMAFHDYAALARKGKALRVIPSLTSLANFYP